MPGKDPIIALRIAPELAALVDHAAVTHGVSRSAVVRRAVQQYFADTLPLTDFEPGQ